MEIGFPSLNPNQISILKIAVDEKELPKLLEKEVKDALNMSS